jgi:hypothetical protein
MEPKFSNPNGNGLIKFGTIGFHCRGMPIASKNAYSRAHTNSTYILNLRALRDVEFNKSVFMWEDLDFNVRANNQHGIVTCRCYRFQQVNVTMKSGGCSDGVPLGNGDVEDDDDDDDDKKGGNTNKVGVTTDEERRVRALAVMRQTLSGAFELSHKKHLQKSSNAQTLKDELVERACSALNHEEFGFIETEEALREFVTENLVVEEVKTLFIKTLGETEGEGALKFPMALKFTKQLLQMYGVKQTDQ